ncbi:class II aldolase/adducin family protein [Mycolicibacterium frederiksbergense]|nr:class II aldolase/adducin family protein [Mycolicibacterium frederiksbergense]
MSNSRRDLIQAAHSIFERRLTHGCTGNLSVREGDQIVLTSTGCNLGALTTDELAVVAMDGTHLAGPKPTKEAFLHLAMLNARPELNAVVHTHSPAAAAVSCLDVVDGGDAIPPLTAYFAMRIGRLPMLPYMAPGDETGERTVAEFAREHHALLLRNHGPVVAGVSIAQALDHLEELEHTAELYLRLHGLPYVPLTTQRAAALEAKYRIQTTS